MSASNRYSSHADNRNANGSMAGEKTSSRVPRIKTQENTARSQQKPSTRSPASGPDRPAHKRTLSGTARTNSMRSTEERERRTEKHPATTRETTISRIRSPDRRSAPTTDKARATDGRRSAETRSRDQRQEAPAQGMNTPANRAHAGWTLKLTFSCATSSMGTGSKSHTTYICPIGVSNIDTAACFPSARICTTKTTL